VLDVELTEAESASVMLPAGSLAHARGALLSAATTEARIEALRPA
jgi:hypothetical protein